MRVKILAEGYYSLILKYILSSLFHSQQKTMTLSFTFAGKLTKYAFSAPALCT